MKIWVMLKNGKFDHVPDYLLGTMISAGEVRSIKRSTGWADIGVYPFRKGESEFCYYGPERRRLIQQRLCHTCPYFKEGKCTDQICQCRYIRFRNYTRE